MTTVSIAPPIRNFNNDPIMIQIETDRKTLVGDTYEWTEDNLSGYVKVIGVREDDTEYFITELNPNYSTADGKYAINLARFLDLALTPPPDDDIYAGYGVGQLVGASGAVVIQHGDQFGTPKMIEDPLQQSSYYQVITGSSKYWNGFSGMLADTLVVLHSWKSFKQYANFNQFYKPVLKDDPEYLSIYCADASASLTLNLRVYKSDGTFVDSSQPAETLLRGVNYLNVQPSSIGVTGVTGYQSYRIGFNSDPALGYLYYTVLDQEPDNVLYFLMDNGCGGLETVRVQGKKTHSHKVSYTEQEKPVWLGSDFREGLIEQSFKTGLPIIQANTGYADKLYIEHLTQLVYSTHIWLIDTVRSKFLRYRVTTTTVEESDDQDDLFNLKLEFAQGWKDYSSNTFNQ